MCSSPSGDSMLDKFKVGQLFFFSFPDCHMDELHRALPGSEAYLGKIVVKKESDIPQDADPSEYITAEEDYMLRRQAIHSNGHIVGKFAAIRLNSFLKKTLVNTVGITDYSIRTEFQSRTALHWHMIGESSFLYFFLMAK